MCRLAVRGHSRLRSVSWRQEVDVQTGLAHPPPRRPLVSVDHSPDSLQAEVYSEATRRAQAQPATGSGSSDTSDSALLSLCIPDHVERSGEIHDIQGAYGAGRGNRTLTLSPELDFESSASTNSAIPARLHRRRRDRVAMRSCRLSVKCDRPSNAAKRFQSDGRARLLSL